uniref:Uncharacterized protein n=1 Tax=Arion vulgaris TaxID=1028688 RepID=A0A0B6ZF74_9EUPU
MSGTEQEYTLHCLAQSRARVHPPLSGTEQSKKMPFTVWHRAGHEYTLPCLAQSRTRIPSGTLSREENCNNKILLTSRTTTILNNKQQ